ncbi:MAG: hypothetical protein EOO77_14275 [Oxalobacteraceae bacterium]|nr:MAG: hypothetical protein EOO77_14275 [Oxalobacteraceae bacterium]
MTVDRKAIDDMAKIMAALDGKSIAQSEVESRLNEGHSRNAVAPAQPLGDPSIEAMKKILVAFNSAAPVSESVARPVRDMDLEEAMEIEPTPRGARIGSWEIVVNEGRGTKTYDVVSDDGSTVIARNMYLYDAALGLVRRLNEGLAINDKPVRDLLVLEENFARARNDAVTYKNRYQTLHAKGDTRRALVAEDRYDRAAGEAMSAHEEILRLAGIRR